MSDLPIACSLTRDELDARQEELLPGLLRRARSQCDTSTGYRFEFEGTPELFQAVVRTIAIERQCCRFLGFHLDVSPDAGPIWLEISGPEGTRAFLQSLMNETGATG
jgi:hypothetical protein